MRREPDFFGDQELPLVYIAKKLKQALRLEEALTAQGIDYAIETDTYRGGIIFVNERVGAFFYVLPEAEQRAREVVRQAGLKPVDLGA